MEEIEKESSSFIYRKNWYVISSTGQLIGKGVIILSILILISLLTITYIPSPYNIFIVGIWCGLGLIVAFSILKQKSSWIWRPYNTNNLKQDNAELALLLSNISNDIHKYQAASYFNYLAVKSYKNITIVLRHPQCLGGKRHDCCL